MYMYRLVLLITAQAMLHFYYVVTDDPYDFMDLPPAGIAIQGLLRPAFIEEHSVIQKHVSDSKSGTIDLNQVRQDDQEKLEDLGIINGHRQSSKDSSISADELEKGETLGNGTSFYKLEMVKILLISAQGCQTRVEVEDLQKAQPDAIAHSAVKIISRLKAGGEKTTQALKSLCWRCKGIQVEEASIIGVDTLGFDLRACSGMQLHTLRFTFNKRASSEYSAERQLNDLLFPSVHQNLQKKRETRQTES
ncbi:pentatricopeptide repeat (PPR) superfamily protein [Actinidia rufa]|uniref:Pentatricopeptide repeat (PPR) superfamily protein n=1 Tax=Actinidia rufa TaxID=165716 RepID=A0A7J0EE56_9ERIC|nr:pentatricopeptide repeat (PPR) superfamily protein [Actinidia rufa]